MSRRLPPPGQARMPRLLTGVVACGLLAGCITTRPPADVPASPASESVAYGVGDIADCRRAAPLDTMAFRTARLVPAGATVLALGDLAYPVGDAATLASCFEPTWGAHRANVVAVPGNHDYVHGRFDAFRKYFDVSSVDPGFVAYRRELSASWTLIALDSNVHGEALQREYAWLERTLASPSPVPSTAAPHCTIAIWHAPVYSSGLHHGSGAHMREFWRLLDRHGADLVLNGHEHFYEAFEPRDADGHARSDGTGLREFVVGTGGARLFGFWRPPYASRSRVLAHGVLQLSLARGSYAWRFIDVEGRVRDAGSARCRSTQPSE